MKLSKNKRLSDNCNKSEKRRTAKKQEYDLPFSFLVCKNINTDFEKINFEKLYKGIDRKYWHNCILSLENGLLFYCFRFNQIDDFIKKKILSKGGNPETVIYSEYPIRTFDKTYNCEPDIFKFDYNKQYEHIKLFLNMIMYALNNKTIFRADLVDYLNLPKSDLFPD